MKLVVTVYGDPAPQGSKRAFRNKHSGKIQQKESSTRLPEWRADVRRAVEDALAAGHKPTDAPVSAQIWFTYPRPKGHYLPVNSRRTSPQLRVDAPLYPTGPTNDVDKLARAVLDAIGSTGLVYADDGQVVRLDAWKFYIDHPLALDRPGAQIRIWTINGPGGE